MQAYWRKTNDFVVSTLLNCCLKEEKVSMNDVP